MLKTELLLATITIKEVLYKVEWSVSSPISMRLKWALQRPWILIDQEDFFGCCRGMQEGTLQAQGKNA